MTRLLALTVLVAASVASTAAARPTIAPPCRGAQLSGAFAVVPGSAGAGNITYELVLKNVSKTQCVLTGLPQGRLIGRYGKLLPTHVKAAFPGALTAVLVRLAPGKKAYAKARFSPDVPGVGEPVAGKKCELTSWYFRVKGQGGGTKKVKLAPPTPVCEHGQLLFSAYGTTR